MFEILAVGGLIFWSLFTIVIFLEFWCASSESPFWGLTIILLFIAIFQFGGNMTLVEWISTNWIDAILVFVGYVAAGTVYAVIKFKLLTRRIGKAVATARTKHSLSGDLTPDDWRVIQNAVNDATEEWISQRSDGTYELSGMKGKVQTWMALWPWSMIWTVISDWVIEIFNTIYEYISTGLERMLNSEIGEIKIVDPDDVDDI